ncbi:Protein farnesyltransferase subunit beta [Gracilariopsis chorda]|uniref:Protein farnesyltransferase subunit beta n=1 Tax=Gracilariopsis chorda TaxID=448386 RepID=A0A2V3IM36_9FLOR|nr:Protein farnesyltransferase subunit beta [Gracilariopsis chorda]|eukprot:PXF42180.1 Protein farnesyltransferase subunit beta [Gracilariopsis chorda]
MKIPSSEALAQFEKERTTNQGKATDSWSEQATVEERVFLLRQEADPEKPILLLREKHVSWLMHCLHVLPRGFKAFDAVQGWLAFWIVHSLDLLGATVPSETASQVVQHIKRFEDADGGYGGGPGQCSHLACTFSAFMALCALGTDEALQSINRDGLRNFILQMKQEDGSFRVSDGGETDVRAMYCALGVAGLAGFLDEDIGTALRKDCGKYLSGLQAFDGGIGGEPGGEAHGGNTFCGVACAVIIGDKEALDADKVLKWAVMRQMHYEGGFQGRTNKLVDSCYSYWVGALFPLVASVNGSKKTAELFDAEALQRYVLECCQLSNGGLRDKPGVPRDLMHTCYALSGLSVAQHFGKAKSNGVNGVRKTNPVYNLCEDKFEKAWLFFREV